ncbi:hypothetical protein HDU67_003594 [Dinochytrium kinnereticum]|nr:hypothetical protein HDU67_003594 [Dinochytrium kinnereticum]
MHLRVTTTVPSIHSLFNFPDFSIAFRLFQCTFPHVPQLTLIRFSRHISTFIGIYLVATVFATFLCFSSFGAIRARREDEEEAALRQANLPVPCREDHASILSKFYFEWLNPLIRLGKAKSITMEDIPDLSPFNKAEAAVAKFKEMSKKSRIKNLGLQLLVLELPSFLLQVFCSLSANALAIACPVLLYRITAFIQNEEESKDDTNSFIEPLVLAAMLGVAAMFKVIADSFAWHIARHMGIRIRSILVDAIYQKGLRRVTVSPSSTSSATFTAVGGNEGKEGDASQVEIKVYENASGTSEKDRTEPDKEKAERLKAAKKKEEEAEKAREEEEATSVGKIVTLMSSDTEKIRESCMYLYFAITSPPLMIGCLIGLISLLGWPALAGLLILILTIPASYAIAGWAKKILSELMGNTDRRTNIVNETLQGIRIIKFFAWEPNFLRKIKEARSKEMASLVSFFYQSAVSQLLWEGSPLLVSFATFAVYTQIAGKELDAKTAFASIGLFSSLRIPLLGFPEVMVEIFQLNVCIERIQKFLDSPELEKFSVEKEADVRDDESPAFIGFRDAWFSWHVVDEAEESGRKDNNKVNKQPATNETTPLLQTPRSSSSSIGNVSAAAVSSGAFTLRNLNLELPVGGLTGIVGATGSGKSSLIQALLGEMKSLSGKSFLPISLGLGGNVAYVAQTSWLMNATIRDNICFGERFDAVRYDRVIKACALVKDLETFEAGDLTEIGEKGINLSGGQKQRVSLARAVYSHATYILLDDPLSAVDAPTARHLFDQAICGLLANRTRILVTHAVGLTLPRCDHLVVMQNGEVLAAGSPVSSILAMPGVDAVVPIGSVTLDGEALTEVVDNYEDRAFEDYGRGDKGGADGKIISKEDIQIGAVKLSVYISYLIAAGGAVFVTIFLMALGAERGVQAIDSFWIKRWVEAYRDVVNSTESSTIASADICSVSSRLSHLVPGLSSAYPHSAYFLPWATAGMSDIAVSGCVAGGNSTAFHVMDRKPQVNTMYFVAIYGYAIRCVGSYMASNRLHDQLMDRILGAPIRFFDTTPLGRILNRASKDISSIDRDVIPSYYFFFALIMDVVVITIIVTCITTYFIFAFLPFLWIYYTIARDYMASSRELKRLDSVTRSPIYSMFSETLMGASTIRAYNAEERFRQENLRRLDINHRAYFYLWAGNRWLGVRLSTVAGVVIFISATITVLIRDSIGSGLAAIALIWTLSFSDCLIWLIRVQAGLEMSLNAVERVGEYLVIEQERPAVIEDSRPPWNWPSKGEICVRDLELRYSPELDPVLRKVSFDIPGGSKVGIVGRTGAGKSSLTLALFRVIEPTNGFITIDGINVCEIGLHDLRSRLTIIPQDPVLFAGTIRSNMDPFCEFEDAAIWSCLERVHILETMQTTCALEKSEGCSTLLDGEDRSMGPTLSLDTAVAEGGQNFSQGQRQLLCLARALLRSFKVAILDEATASVDNETDGRIQETLRGPDFEGVTVLSIAHRLRTVADYDYILVLDKGQVSQFGSPWDLLQDTDGIFRSMCEESGELAELEQMAKKN